MKYFFIIVVVALALITENGVLAGSRSQSRSQNCINNVCEVVCTENGQRVTCNY
uniref:AKTx n=1 Tax=Strongyloides stercoralis TaxID=6248 RepID=A0A0K0ETR4_STRER